MKYICKDGTGMITNVYSSNVISKEKFDKEKGKKTSNVYPTVYYGELYFCDHYGNSFEIIKIEEEEISKTGYVDKLKGNKNLSYVPIGCEKACMYCDNAVRYEGFIGKCFCLHYNGNRNLNCKASSCPAYKLNETMEIKYMNEYYYSILKEEDERDSKPML
jgi:hypothetical protein